MSISNPKIENPCKKFIEFKGDKGQFFFYDRENEQSVEIPLPLYFVVLDELSTISGYNKKNDCGIYSNEVHSVVTEQLRVKTFKGGESVIGFYADTKDAIKAMGGKFSKSVYALLISEDKSTELVNIKFKGAAFSAWLDKKINPSKYVIGISEFTQERNGNTTYMVPVFKPFTLSTDLLQRAVEADVLLQEYLKSYKANQAEAEAVKAEVAESAPEPIEANGRWNGGNVREQIMAKAAGNDVSDVDDLPFS